MVPNGPSSANGDPLALKLTPPMDLSPSPLVAMSSPNTAPMQTGVGAGMLASGYLQIMNPAFHAQIAPGVRSGLWKGADFVRALDFAAIDEELG